MEELSVLIAVHSGRCNIDAEVLMHLANKDVFVLGTKVGTVKIVDLLTKTITLHIAKDLLKSVCSGLNEDMLTHIRNGLNFNGIILGYKVMSITPELVAESGNAK